ncbi:MAG: PQQ-binding-like beta-propeller repeat protein, partial [Rhizobiales bacterium]|nr:PQQ-binding-like beta-propeller repeat protein [Hyphomicrobiales bacterium]
MTSSYGRTFAVDVNSGRTLWTYTPPDYSDWVGSAQITNSSPVLEPLPRHRYLYAASPDGVVHKLALASGKEVRTMRPPGERVSQAK